MQPSHLRAQKAARFLTPPRPEATGDVTLDALQRMRAAPGSNWTSQRRDRAWTVMTRWAIAVTHLLLEHHPRDERLKVLSKSVIAYMSQPPDGRDSYTPAARWLDYMSPPRGALILLLNIVAITSSPSIGAPRNLSPSPYAEFTKFLQLLSRTKVPKSSLDAVSVLLLDTE